MKRGNLGPNPNAVNGCYQFPAILSALFTNESSRQPSRMSYFHNLSPLTLIRGHVSEPETTPNVDQVHGDLDIHQELAAEPLAAEETVPAAEYGPQESTTTTDQGFSLFSRVSVACFGLVPIVLLAITMFLAPSKQGLGTHQQLGLPPCSMRVIFSIRCPACGMTTSWAHFVRGEWISSLQANPGGFLLAIYSLAFATCCFYSVWKNRMPSYRVQNWMIKTLLVITVVTITHWLFVVGLPNIGS